MLKIEIVDQEVITRRKQDNSRDYYQQLGYVYLVDRDGREERYPEKIYLLLSRDEIGNPVPYKKGLYTFSASSFRVRYNRLEVGFLNLVPLESDKKQVPAS